MLNSLDLLVIVFLGMAAVGLLSLSLMFLFKKTVPKRIGLYAAAVLGMVTAVVGVQLGLSLVSGHLAVGALVGIASIASVVLERMSKGNEKKFGIARILAGAALVVGILNAFIL